jgi:hypothetical protein
LADYLVEVEEELPAVMIYRKLYRREQKKLIITQD